MKQLIRILVQLLFRFSTVNPEVLKAPGPVLLLPNHTSWLDWAFLYAILDDDWKFVTSSTTANYSWFHRKFMVNHRTFPVDPSSPYAAKRMAEFLMGGGRLVLFPEGRITHTTAMMKFYDGTGFLLHKTPAKVITCYLRNALRVKLVRHTGWTQWAPKVTAHFSQLITPPVLTGISNAVARQKHTNWLRDRMIRQQYDVEMEFGAKTLLCAIAESASKQPSKIILEDVTLQELSYRKLMVGVELLAERWMSRPSFQQGERVGVLLPNVNSMPVTILSLWALGKVPAILNFSTGIPVMLQCAQLAGFKQLITSRQFIEKAKLSLDSFTAAGIEVFYLEDVRSEITGPRKFGALLKHWIYCGAGFRNTDESHPDATNRTAVILFTSGSEGVPKGVELTHRNLLANVRQVVTRMDVSDDERFFNAMPLFHSFGLTACTLFPLIRGLYTFMYPSPLHYRAVPAVVYDKNCTVMVGTNTFLNGYARKAHPFDFNSVKFLVAGAEKIQAATAEVWARKFGVRLLEGYGATECSPAICMNSRLEPRFGSVGRIMPGMEWRLEPIDGIAEGGRLFVRGANIMKGYLNKEANETFLALKGWYDTGDLARVDEDGYVYLLGRLKRFAKVSGEMVSLTAVEDALAGAFPQHGLRCETAVIAIPDSDKGERLIAVTNEPKLTMDEVRQAIKSKGLTNLCVPREVRLVREIPKLGTGKTNHRALMEVLNKPEATPPQV